MRLAFSIVVTMAVSGLLMFSWPVYDNSETGMQVQEDTSVKKAVVGGTLAGLGKIGMASALEDSEGNWYCGSSKMTLQIQEYDDLVSRINFGNRGYSSRELADDFLKAKNLSEIDKLFQSTDCLVGHGAGSHLKEVDKDVVDGLRMAYEANPDKIERLIPHYSPKTLDVLSKAAGYSTSADKMKKETKYDPGSADTKKDTKKDSKSDKKDVKKDKKTDSKKIKKANTMKTKTNSDNSATKKDQLVISDNQSVVSILQ